MHMGLSTRDVNSNFAKLFTKPSQCHCSNGDQTKSSVNPVISYRI